ncbi:MAG: recombinase family protein, partial [Candidatus Thiodiazotropha sp. (ex Lucinoma aequizonata)]|nr:recombinase family protein [Candidatus Thiodiazotropha sp. (ex Lucinoma aequizonata)]
MKAALYLRSSKDRSDVSIDAQRQELKKLTNDQKLEIIHEYTDVVESTKSANQPGFQAMLRELKSPTRNWDTLLMADTSRLSPRRYVAQAFKHDARKRNIEILYSKVPDADPITAVILDSVFETMDKVYSLMSKDNKRVFDLVKDFGTSQSTKIDSIFDSLLCPDR